MYGLGFDSFARQHPVEAGDLLAMLPASSRFVQAVAPSLALPSVDVLLAAIELRIRCLGWTGQGERPELLHAASPSAELPTEERMREVAQRLGIEVTMDG